MAPRILLIDNDLDAVSQAQQTLEAEGFEVLTTVTGQAGIAMAQMQQPSLVLLDLDLPDIDGYAVCRALRGAHTTAKIPILVHSARTQVSDKVACFKVGANDYIVKPVAPAELMARVRAALRSEEQPLARVFAVWGSKGGVGTTTVASNVAVALRCRTGKRVTLVDASVLGGTLEVMLNLAPRHTMADLLPRLEELDSELFASVLTRHSSGIHVLPSVPWGRDGSSFEPAQLERVIAWLQTATDYLVVDTAPSLDLSTQAVLRLADLLVVVLTPEMTSLRNARLFVQSADAAAPERESVVFALNRYPMQGCLKLKDIEGALQAKVAAQIPSDEALVTYSINRGVPLVISHPRCPVAQSFYRLADALVAASEKKKRAPSRSPTPSPHS